MLKVLKALLNLFRKGERLSDSKTWKVENSIVLVGLLSTFFVSLDDFAKSTGINLGMTDSELEQVARWVVSTFGLYIMAAKVVTSKRIGLPAKKEPDWLAWKGGDCPCPDAKLVEIEVRGGTIETTDSPKNVRWHHNGHRREADIVRYRILL